MIDWVGGYKRNPTCSYEADGISFNYQNTLKSRGRIAMSMELAVVAKAAN